MNFVRVYGPTTIQPAYTFGVDKLVVLSIKLTYVVRVWKYYSV